jgi:hypothetical protein
MSNISFEADTVGTEQKAPDYTVPRCPTCKSALDVERTHRPGSVRVLLFFLPVRSYKCYRCLRRFTSFS